MAGKIDEQGVYPAILDIGKNDTTADGASTHQAQQNSRGGGSQLRQKDDVPNLIPTGPYSFMHCTYYTHLIRLHVCAVFWLKCHFI